MLTLEFVSNRIGTKSIDEIPLPPAAPANVQSSFGQTLGHMSDGSKLGAARTVGALAGGIISNASNEAHAAEQARYQDDMNLYQRKMAEFSKPRYSPTDIARLVQRQNDVVADNMINFVFGSDALLVKPAPFFRELESVEVPEIFEIEQDNEINHEEATISLMLIVCPIISGLLMMFFAEGYSNTTKFVAGAILGFIGPFIIARYKRR